MKSLTTVVFILFTLFSTSQNRDKAFEINQKLGRGINYGNMFEAPSENEWGNPWRTKYAGMIADLGFNHVRIPIRWEPAERSSATEPYTINAAFLSRIKQVADSVLNNGMAAVINMHHHEALYENPNQQKARFLAQWKQISEYFKDYPDELVFELMNEPHGNLTAEKWNELLVDALAKIREDNPERVVMIGTPEYGGLGGLSYLQIPDDEFIILTVHYYNPFQFTHQGAGWVGDGTEADAWLGTKWNDSETEREIIQNDFAPLLRKSQEFNIPIHIGEFGAYNKADIVSRKKWTTYIARYLETLNWSWAYWEFSAGFGIYDPARSKYNQELVDALLHNEMPEPAHYVGTSVYTSNFQTSNDGWSLQKHSGSATLTRENSGLKVAISNGGTEGWHLQLTKGSIKLQAGKKYRITFKAKASAERGATIYLGKNGEPWGAYSGYNGISLTDTFSVYAFIFEMQETDLYSRIVFDIGKSDADVWIKDIVLEEIVLTWPTSTKTIENYKTTIYPNPVNEKLHVNNLDDFQQIEIYNLHGKHLMSKHLERSENSIDLSGLASGMYFIRLSSDDKSQSVKILKK